MRVILSAILPWGYVFICMLPRRSLNHGFPQPAWFRRRAAVAAAYGAAGERHDWLRSSIVSSNLGVDAELHQLTSPKTAYHFLDDVLRVTTRVDSSMSELELFGQYVGKSWAGIIRSSGVLP